MSPDWSASVDGQLGTQYSESPGMRTYIALRAMAKSWWAGNDGAVWDMGGVLEHLPLKRALDQPKVERPVEILRPPVEVGPKVSVQHIRLAPILDHLDAVQPLEARGRRIVSPVQILQQHDTLLRMRQQYRPQR